MDQREDVEVGDVAREVGSVLLDCRTSPALRVLRLMGYRKARGGGRERERASSGGQHVV